MLKLMGKGVDGPKEEKNPVKTIIMFKNHVHYYYCFLYETLNRGTKPDLI